MKRLHIYLSLFVCAAAIAISTISFAAPASDGISAIESAYKSATDISATFTQNTQIAMLDRTRMKSGLFKYKKGGKLRIEYEDGMSYVSDGRILWRFTKGDDATLETYAVNDKNIPREALSFLSGFGELKKEFKIEDCKSFKDAEAGSTALHLIPKSKSAHYASLDALFNKANILSELIIYNESGNVSSYKFSEVRVNQNIPDNLFTLSTGKATPEMVPQE